MKTILSNIDRKFKTSKSPLVGLHRREMPNPTSNEYFLDYIAKYYIKRTAAGFELDPSGYVPMTPSAYMQQQAVLRALEDLPGGQPWIDKTMFRNMVEQESTFQYAIAPKLEPPKSKRVTGEDAYVRHIRSIFERFGRQNKQDVFKHPDQYSWIPIE